MGRSPRRGVLSLARAISRAGAATRTQAARLVGEGRVRVNGRAATSPALRVDPARDRIEVDGVPLAEPPAPGEVAVLALNKPRGVLVTRSDPEGRPTAFSLLPPGHGLLRFVGRLDGASAGLLLATADTRLAAALEDPARGVPRVYRVKIHPRAGEGGLALLRAGAVLDGRRARPLRVEEESRGPRSSWVRLTLGEGRNREVRRLCAAAGFAVEHLVRISYGPVLLGQLPPSAVRILGPGEVRALRAAAGISPSPRSSPAREGLQ